MKVAFVLGFFDPVEDMIRSKFASETDAGSLICIGRRSHKNLQINVCKSRLNQTLADGTDDPVLILYARFRGQEWVENALTKIIEGERERHRRKIFQFTLTNLNHLSQQPSRL